LAPSVPKREQDRWRQNDLVDAGWRVLRFTARMLEEAPQLVIAVITEALAG
jgi:very-short-patch-repair endonuclease